MGLLQPWIQASVTCFSKHCITRYLFRLQFVLTERIVEGERLFGGRIVKVVFQFHKRPGPLIGRIRISSTLFSRNSRCFLRVGRLGQTPGFSIQGDTQEICSINYWFNWRGYVQKASRSSSSSSNNVQEEHENKKPRTFF